MATILDQTISIFPKVTRTHEVSHESLRMVLRRIQRGGYRHLVAPVRALKTTADKDTYDAAKKELPSFTPCCDLRHRAAKAAMADKLLSCTGLVHFDYDDLDDVEGFKARLAQHPAVVFAFVGPSGQGLKVGIAAEGVIDEESYKHVWQTVIRQLREEYPGYLPKEDEHVKFLHALCFVSDDPAIYVNDKATPLEIPPYEPPEPEEEPPGEEEPYALATLASALLFVPGYDDYKEWIAIGQALHATGQQWARALWDDWSAKSPKYNATVQGEKWRTFHQDGRRRPAYIVDRAEAHGWQETPPPGITSHNGTNYLSGNSVVLHKQNSGEEGPQVVSSLTSLHSDLEWPVIAKEAYHGLAGDIVNTIAPESEADPVALLLQLLDYFGTVVGRHAFHWVEATQHYTNTFVCLVGATSRGRKGTAYDHIERLFRDIDPSWSFHNVIGGCGSGEGVIAAVRDPILKHEPIRENKLVVGYEEVEVDPGVTDKRLLIYEAEFSSVLKVASRENNLLSEVLRRAWETGNLQNKVKTSPLQATGAHISVIGHITIDELQKTLTTTEMANGFGNRILWACVRRSKRLPEGGALDPQALDPLKQRLQDAVKQAHSIDRLQRDATAKRAWSAVFDPLTDDRPGLVGALLARAEAQILRLSMLYALLDSSAEIRHVHLNAALAVWQYVEASIQYIFGTSLGDAVADTILADLEQSPKGLTRNQILTHTLHGHTRADELDRVLRLLERLQLIKVEKQAPKGRGRPTELITRLGGEVSEINTPNYVSISNDAAKCPELPRTEPQNNCEVIPSETAESCLHEHTDDPPTWCYDCEQPLAPPDPAAPVVDIPAPVPSFSDLVANALYCADCGQAQNVRLDGADYCCTVCGVVVGTTTTTDPGTNASYDEVRF